VFKWPVLILLSLLTFLGLTAWLRAGKMWHFYLGLGTLELGHWLAILALASGLTAFRFLTGLRRYLYGVWGLILAILLMLPAIQASWIFPEFSWRRLWHLASGPDTRPVVTERREYAPGLEMVIHRPGNANSPAPWFLVLHSGGWNSGDPAEFQLWNRELAAHGYAVLCPEYRLAQQHPWPAPREDVIRAVAWAREHAAELNLDPAKLILMGRSAGGQIASASALGVPELEAKGVVCFYAPADLFFARQYAYEEDILNSLRLLRDYLGGDPAEFSEAYRTASAIELITPTSPPVLMVHGARDTLVWVRQSQRFDERLGQAGISSTLVELPWATHACDYLPGTPGGQASMLATLRFAREVFPR